MIKKINTNNKKMFWCISYGLVIVFGGQIFITYLYNDLSNKNDKFIMDEIKNEKIVNIETFHFTPGKGSYNEIKLSNNKKYPLFLDSNDYENLITENSIIQKKSNENEFLITNISKIYKFKICNFINGEILIRLFVLIASSLVAISTFFRYVIQRNKNY
jgi:hypothetical protein